MSSNLNPWTVWRTHVSEVMRFQQWEKWESLPTKGREEGKEGSGEQLTSRRSSPTHIGGLPCATEGSPG